MGHKPTGRPRGRPRKVAPPQDFGASEPDPVPAAEVEPEPTPQEILDLGLPPEDAAGIQKWNYRALSTLAALALRDQSISMDTRARRFIQASMAAAKHYPEAARYDLAAKIEADAAALVGRKKAKAAAKLETCEPAGAAKVIPIRSSDVEG